MTYEIAIERIERRRMQSRAHHFGHDLSADRGHVTYPHDPSQNPCHAEIVDKQVLHKLGRVKQFAEHVRREPASYGGSKSNGNSRCVSAHFPFRFTR